MIFAEIDYTILFSGLGVFSVFSGASFALVWRTSTASGKLDRLQVDVSDLRGEVHKIRDKVDEMFLEWGRQLRQEIDEVYAENEKLSDRAEVKYDDVTERVGNLETKVTVLESRQVR